MNKQIGLTNIIKLMVMRTKLAASLSIMDWASFLAQSIIVSISVSTVVLHNLKEESYSSIHQLCSTS